MSGHAYIESLIGLARKRLVASAHGSWVEDRPGAFLFAAPHASRVIGNGAWLTGDTTLDRAWQDDVTATFARLGHDCSLYVPAGFPRAETSLRESAFVRRIQFPTMRLDAAPPVRTSGAQDEPVRVETAADLDSFIGLCARCFEFSAATSGLCRALLAGWTPGKDRQALLLRSAGTVVAVAMVITVEAHAVIDWVATHPDFRRRGFGAVVTEPAIRTGFDLGAKTAVLHASAAGAGLYRRLGFQEIGAMTLYSPQNRVS